MKINERFVVKNIAGELVVVPTGSAIKNFNGLITMNEVAGFIWTHLAECDTPDDMVSMVLEEYEGDETTIRKEVIEFLDTLKKVGMIAY